MRAHETDAEHKLWQLLRNRQLGGHKFVRQLPIGPYIADFACRDGNLVIEVDGSQHAGSASDEQRSTVLLDHGYAVLRFWNNDVLTNLEAVALAIVTALEKAPSPARRFATVDLSPEGRGDAAAPAGLTSTGGNIETLITSPFGGEVAAQRRVRGPFSPSGTER